MRASHEGFGAGLGGLVAAHHVADRINAHFVEAAVAHGLLDQGGSAAVCIRQIGHRELTIFLVPRVTEGGQLLLPVPNLVAQSWLDSKLVVEPQLDNAVDMAQRFAHLKVLVVGQALLKGGDDVLPPQTGSAWAAHCKDERKTEFAVVSAVERLDAGEFVWRAIRQSRTGLFVGRFGGQRLADHGLAGQLGVGANQAELGFKTGFAHDAGHAVFELRQRPEGSVRQCGLRDPGRMFVQAVQQVCGL